MRSRLWAFHVAGLASALVAAALALAPSAVSAQSPEQLFTVCNACHTVGAGIRVGPDLAGVTERRSEEWLLRFIPSSQGMVRSGDPTANELFTQFHQTVMPDQPLTPDQIRSILAFIAAGGPQDAVYSRPITHADIVRGEGIYQGLIRLENGGPSCNSCHEVRNDAVIGGGVLARELTDVFSRLGGNGVGGILGSPPFPVMERAYADHPLTPDEVHEMVAFLKYADEQHAFQQPRDYGWLLIESGLGVLAVLLVLYGLIWMRRRTRSVNQAIYDRQVRSS